jgi:hypothetical protein
MLPISWIPSVYSDDANENLRDTFIKNVAYIALSFFAIYFLHRIGHPRNEQALLNERRSLRALHLHPLALGAYIPPTFLQEFERPPRGDRFGNIPQGFFSSLIDERATKIVISGLGVQGLPPFTHCMQDLRCLEITNNYLTKLPKGIERLSSLERLILDQNHLIKLSKRVFALKNLSMISLNRNRLQTLPDLFSKIDSLTSLTLNSNQMQTLPSSFSSLTMLKNLRVCGNKLSDLGGVLDPIRSLEVAHFSRNRIERIPTALFKGPLLSLDFSTNSLRSVPSEIGFATQMRGLDLSENHIEEIPEEIGGLEALIDCNLSYNNLSAIPPQVGNLSSLVFLNLAANARLRNIPYSLSRVSSLRDLNLEYTLVSLSQYSLIMSRIQDGQSMPLEAQIGQMLTVWAEAGQKEVPRNVMDLSLNEKEMVFEWLLRLEKTIDFTQQKQQVTGLCIDMLASLENPAFKEVFFLQLEDNLSDCEDRALLNLIMMHLNYRMHATKDSSPVDHFGLILKSAKTLELLRMIPQKIMKQEVVEEDTEVYLYYLSRFQKETDLLLPFRIHMHFHEYAKKKIRELNGLDELSFLGELKQKDPLDLIFSHLPHQGCLYVQKHFPARAQLIEQELAEELELIDSKAEELGSSEFVQKMESLTKLRTVLYRIAFLECTSSLQMC